MKLLVKVAPDSIYRSPDAYTPFPVAVHWRAPIVAYTHLPTFWEAHHTAVIVSAAIVVVAIALWYERRRAIFDARFINPVNELDVIG